MRVRSFVAGGVWRCRILHGRLVTLEEDLPFRLISVVLRWLGGLLAIRCGLLAADERCSREQAYGGNPRGKGQGGPHAFS